MELGLGSQSERKGTRKDGWTAERKGTGRKGQVRGKEQEGTGERKGTGRKGQVRGREQEENDR